ncbi:MAG TPA: hypothetical protein VH120_12495 [Gemmataceae bacterium]|nr:hypothetical protein [Gemmataceae bacterium]
MIPFLADGTVQVVEYRSYAVGWGTLALVNAGLAQSKNRSGLAWWFISLFLGPIATLIVVLLDKLPDPNAFREPGSRT